MVVSVDDELEVVKTAFAELEEIGAVAEVLNSLSGTVGGRVCVARDRGDDCG